MRGRLLALRTSLFLLIVWSASGPTMAIDKLTFKTGGVDGGTWSLESAHGEIALRGDDRLAVSLNIVALVLPQPIGDVSRATLLCEAFATDAGAYRCAAATVKLELSAFGGMTLQGDVRYWPAERRLSIESGTLISAAGPIGLTAVWRPQAWSVLADASDLHIVELAKRLRARWPAMPPVELASGQVSGQLALSARRDEMPSLDATLTVAELSFSNESGTAAAESIGAGVEINIRPLAGSAGYRIETNVSKTSGEAYFEPVYVDFSKRPARLDVEAEYHDDPDAWVVTSLEFSQEEALDLRLTGRLPPGAGLAGMDADIDVIAATFPAFYEGYVKGFFVGTPFSQLQTSGALSGKIRIDEGKVTDADVIIDTLNADDAAGRLAIYGANGRVMWKSRDKAREPGDTPPSTLNWDGGFVYAIGYGAGSMSLRTRGGDVVLDSPLRVPLLDGALLVNTFAARGMDTETPELDFDARLEPLALRRLTAAFGWPAFSGTLSGELPLLSLRNGVITIGGSLVARAFDGTIRVSDLRIEDPFQPGRRGGASIEIDNVDLRRLTEVFSFGHMEGRLDGYVRNLRTFRSRPIAFEARFFTPPGDRSRRRISRRALNNISDIAGGGVALVSSGLLGFFEEFSYATIGIGCTLALDICQMSGVEPTAGGYFLVKGRLIPRIDVIGHAQQVNWPQLVAQIEKALESRDIPTSKPQEETR